MADPGAFGGGEDLERFKAILAGWRTSLVDLSGRNRLLNFRHTRSATLEITLPDAGTLVAGLERGWEFAPLPDEESQAEEPGAEEPRADRDRQPPAVKGGGADGIVTQKTTAPALTRALNSLRSKSTQLFNDYGLWTLQLGVGMLRWREDGATTSSDAPLVLLPVTLQRTANGRVRLVANDDEEPRVNPALRVKLEQFHIDWTPVTEQEPTDLDAVLDAVTTAVAGKSGWEVSRRAVVALFASHKEAMYQDLLDNEGRVLDSDLVRAVALGPRAGLGSERFDFEEIELERIDELSPPEDSPLVLDADASQRQAVAAAVAGRSFVLDGPPGTGKSQTITNMIAGLMHAGRSVLFVSEKAAALDVVLDRLKSVGLDSYALALHSHNTGRRAVAQELGRALAEEPTAPRLSQQAVAQAREARQALSAYAEAMNEVSEPLGRSLHDVIGRVGKLADAPVAYLTPGSASDGSGKQKPFEVAALGAEDLRLIIEATEDIAAAWQAVADPSFPWRDLRAGSSHPRLDLEQAMAALDGLASVAARYRSLSADGTPIADEDGVTRLISLLALLDARHPVPESWLTIEEFADGVAGPVDDFLADLRTALRARAAARTAAGARWEELPTRLKSEPGAPEQALDTLSPPGLDPAPLTEERATGIAHEFDTVAGGLERTHHSVTDVAQRLGMTAPGDVAEAEAVCEIAAHAGGPQRPLGRWLVPGGAAEADRAAVRVVADALRAFFDRRAAVLAAQAHASAAVGLGWDRVPAALDALPPPSELALADLEPAGPDLTALTRREAADLADWFSGLAATLDTAEQSADSAATLLGTGRPVSTADAEDLVSLTDLATAPHRTLDTWLDPQVLPRVREACAEITDAAEHLAEAERTARGTFRPETVAAPELPDVVRRLTEGARGIGGMLSGAVRADRKVVAAITVSGSWRGELYDRLPLALAWHTAHQRLRTLAAAHAGLLGRYAGTELPDVPALQAALAHAESVHRLAPDTVQDTFRRSRLADQVADGRNPSPELLDHGRALRDALATWRQALGRPHLTACADALTKRPLREAAGWLRAHLEPLTRAVELIDTVTSTGGRDGGTGFEYTLSEARTAVTAAHRAQRETAAFTAEEQTDRRLLGPWYRGLETDPTTLRDAAPDGSADLAATGELLRCAGDMMANGEDHRADDTQRELLGRYAPDGRPDTDALRRALEAARTVERLAAGTLADPALRVRLAEHLADERPVPHDLLRQAEQIRTELDAWRQHAAQPHLAACGAHLLTRPLDEAGRWFRAHVEPFEDAADLVRAVARVVDTSDPRLPALSLGRARQAVTAVVEARAAEARFTESAVAHRELLGDLYQGTDTDRDTVLDAVDWARKVRRTAHGSHAAPLSAAAARTMLTAPADPSVAARHADWQRQRDTLVEHFKKQRARGLRGELAQSLPAARKCLTRLADDPYGPEAWTSCADALSRLRQYGLDGLPAQLAQRDVSAADFPAAVERAVLTAWIERRLELDARLKPMRAVERDQLVERFRTADRELVEAAHAEVIAACNARRPRRTNVGQAAVLRRQAELKRRHKPVRVLLDETRDVVRLIKPCFMMSPLTVSQFLPPDFRFDVVIFDEASQVLPQDAVNSVYRGDALIVAGDQKQLPPTSFFSAGGAGDDDDEWEEDGADSFESVLDACIASGILRRLSLRWHYRSRHENLIAFSNHEFYYEKPMVIFPGALEKSPDVGVEFFKAEGTYDRGGRSDNAGEAAMVAQRVIHHFATRPGHTLGVVALSKAQAEAIEEAVQKARAARPDLDRFFTEDRLDGFFVKNLETVQGDERDVIILSVGYAARDKNGKLLSTFGPINRDGGWRRLNVAVTRARRRMEVVASFHGSELGDSANKSVQHLKRYLQYAAQGPQILETAAADPDAVPESPFEEEVLDVLRGWGYSVQPQVGVAGFRIDMAVRHPDAPGSYALGIECDGVMYHSSRAARDRDRLREAVLRDLGWKLHRIWGTDWYRSRREATARLRAAVEAACAQDPHAVKPAEPTPPPVTADPVASGAATGGEPSGPAMAAAGTAPAEPAAAQTVTFVPVDDGPPTWSRPYREAEEIELVNLRITSSKQRGMRGVELQDPHASGVVADVALAVIKAEGPITEDMVFTRVRSAWGLSRSGQVIQDRVRRVLGKLVSKKTIVRVGEAYDLPDRELNCARTPTHTSARKVAQVPSVERQLVIRSVIDESPGVGREDLLREVARFFGWARLGSEIRDALTGDIDALVRDGALRETGAGLMPGGGD